MVHGKQRNGERNKERRLQPCSHSTNELVYKACCTIPPVYCCVSIWYLMSAVPGSRYSQSSVFLRALCISWYAIVPLLAIPQAIVGQERARRIFFFVFVEHQLQRYSGGLLIVYRSLDRSVFLPMLYHTYIYE